MKLSAPIVRDRLEHRSRVLRIRWQAQGDKLLKQHDWLGYVNFLDRLTRQLAAIESAVKRLRVPA